MTSIPPLWGNVTNAEEASLISTASSETALQLSGKEGPNDADVI